MSRERNVPRVVDRGMIVAHRGASRAAPENTMVAFAEALRRGATWIEFDVSLLGDGTPVIHHDAALGRTVAGSGPLADLTAADLPGLDAGSWFAAEFTGEPVPTLDELLQFIGVSGLHANLEMKPHGAAPGPIAAAVAKALAAHDWAAARVIVSSFDQRALAELRALRPDQPLALLFDDPPPGWHAQAEALAAQAMHVKYTYLTASFLQEAGRHGVDVRVFTVNDPVLMQPFWAHGLTGVFTDDTRLFEAPGALPDGVLAEA